MTLNLGQLLPRAYRELGDLYVSVATSGATTYLIDTRLLQKFPDDSLKDAPVFVIRDAGGASAAPENEFTRGDGFAVGSGTLAFVTALTTAVASGDTYGIGSEKYPLHVAIQSVNDALRSLGDFTRVDTTTLDTASSQTEYAASLTWKRKPPLRIDIQNRIDSNDNQWTQIYNWHYTPAAGGSTGLIVFDDQLPVGYDLRVWYMGEHPEVSAYSDYIDETLDPELIMLATAERMLNWRVGQSGGSDAYLIQKLNDIRTRLSNRAVTHRPWKKRRQPRILITRGVSETTDTFTTPAPP